MRTKINGDGWTTYGTGGSEVGQFYYPLGISYDSATEYIYVTDSYNHRIVKTKLNIDGTFTDWTTYGTQGSGVGQFKYPRGISYDSATGYFYVTDHLNYRIVKLYPEWQ